MSTNQVSAYLYGHTHENKVNFENNSKSLAINTASLSNGDYRVVAIDNNGLSTTKAKIDKWPVVLITAPVDKKLGGENPYYSAVPSSAASTIRALVFDRNEVVRVDYFVDGIRHGIMRRVSDDPASSFYNLWESNEFNTLSLSPGDHTIRVTVLSREKRELPYITFYRYFLNTNLITTEVSASPATPDPYADRVVKSFDSGNGFKGGWDINGNGQADPGEPLNVPVSPDKALGAPDNWFVSILPEEYIVFEFTDNTIIDAPGPDLFVREIGDSGERVKVLVSNDGVSFSQVGIAGSGGTYPFDLSSIPGFCGPVRYVMVYDGIGGAAPGFDLDSLGATAGSIGPAYDSAQCIRNIDGITPLKQDDIRWGSNDYAYTQEMIAELGSYLTSAAMIINYYGSQNNFSVTPQELNNWLNPNNAIQRGKPAELSQSRHFL